MNRLLFVSDIQERYQVSAPTARKIMRSMIHIKSPKLAVNENVLSAFEREQSESPSDNKKQKMKKNNSRNSASFDTNWIPGVSEFPLRR